ncbi:hypothetical protein [Actinoplanes sp. NPDC026619]|uniref:hypothetical protein n=1 Tax=Actinoplanes sp. NPDC026619 TaxID=3155798 RepID=UPI00340C05B1
MNPTFAQVRGAASHNFFSAVEYSGSLRLRINPENQVPAGATALQLNRYLDGRILDLVNHLEEQGIQGAMAFTSDDGSDSSNGKQHVRISIEGGL